MRATVRQKVITLSLDSRHTFVHSPCVGQCHFKPEITDHWKSLDGVVVIFPNAEPLIPNTERDGTFQFPLKHYQAVIRSFSRWHPDVKIAGIPQATLNAVQHANGVMPRLPPRDQLLAMVPPNILTSLYDYQKDGVAFAVAHGGRALLADEMGVGKSHQGLALLGVYQWEWPAVVLCPSSLKGQWIGLIEKWLTPLAENPQFRQRYAKFFTGDSCRLVKQIHKGTDAMDALINIMSYDMVVGKQVELAAMSPQVCLLDESHYIKSRTAKRVKVLLPILGKSKRILLLSGTPSLNRPAEIFPQVHLLRRDVFSSFHAFGERYCAAKKERFGWVYDGHSNLTELNVVLEALCMIRRTKDEVIDNTALPPKHRERVTLELTAEQRRLVDKGVKNLQDIEKKRNVDPVTRKAAFMTLWREIGQVKIPSVVEYVNNLLPSGEKFVLFAHHQAVLDELEVFLTRKAVKFIRIDGKTKSHHRTKMVDDFQQDPEIRVALLSITAAGVGLTLTAAHIVIFAELYFTCGSLLQAEDRCHRIGQTHPVSVRYLLAERTADEQIWYILVHKMEVLGEMLGATDTKLQARRSVFDQELTQTDMNEFIGAIINSGGATSSDASDASGGPMDQYVETPKVKKTKFTWSPSKTIFSDTSSSNTSAGVSSVILPDPSEYLGK